MRTHALRVLPWLRDLDHMETRFCDMIPAAISAFCSTPHLLLSWRQHTLSGQGIFLPISTNIIASTSAQEDSNGHMDNRTDRCSTLEFLSSLGMSRGYKMPQLRNCSSNKPGSLKLHHATELERKLQEQYRIMTAHRSACSQLLKSSVAGGDVDQSICIEQLSAALHQAQASAAASVLGMFDWRPQVQSPCVHVNSEWQQRWSQQRASAACSIQTFWRSRVAKENRIKQQSWDAAVRIQSWLRGLWVRRQGLLNKLRSELKTRQSKAVRAIQATWRGHRVRKLLSRARAAAYSYPTSKEMDSRAAGGEHVLYDSDEDEDLLLPELGGDLMRELGLLHAPPASAGSVRVTEKVAHAATATVVRRTAQLPNARANPSILNTSSVPQLPASVSPNPQHHVAPRSQKLEVRSPVEACASPVADASQISSMLDSDSPLARRFRLHKMQQAAKQQSDPYSRSHGSHSVDSGTNRDQISTFRPSMDMPHVHVAALAAIRAQQQEYAATAPSHSTVAAASAPSAVLDSEQRSRQQPPSPTSDTSSPQQHTNTVEGASKRRTKAAENVMKEWGFESEATAHAYLRSKRRMLNKKNSRNNRRVHPTAPPHVRSLHLLADLCVHFVLCFNWEWCVDHSSLNGIPVAVLFPVQEAHATMGTLRPSNSQGEAHSGSTGAVRTTGPSRLLDPAFRR